jgi:sulfate/thiosulfate-binding protein
MSNRVPLRLCAVFCLTLLILSAGCTKSSEEGKEESVTLVLAAYTTPREAYGRAIIPAFQRYWKERTGQRVEFQQSYLGSGAQARAVIGGFEADIVALSLAGDVEKVAKAGLITHDWKSGPYKGMVSTSIVVIAVRPGNPKKMTDWVDLTRPGLNILTPDPRTSGGAMWNICAIYGAALRGHAGVPKDKPAAAAGLLKGVFKNVSVMDKGARESITNFEKGIGDVALTYENEVLVGRAAGQKYEYVIPASTILIENPAAVVDKYADKHGVREAAEAFVEFLASAESQRAYAQYGLRPVDPNVLKEVQADYPPVKDLWTIEYLGGWPRVIEEIFGPQGVFTQVYRGLREQ